MDNPRLNKLFADGGLVDASFNPTIVDRGWWRCLKCGHVYESNFRQPMPFEHKCKPNMDEITMTFEEWWAKETADYDHALMFTTKLWAHSIWKKAQASINNPYDKVGTVCDDGGSLCTFFKNEEHEALTEFILEVEPLSVYTVYAKRIGIPHG